MQGENKPIDDAAKRRRHELDDLLSGTFNSILSVEEKSLQNRFTKGLSMSEIHTVVAVGLHEENPMSAVAARLNVTLATLTVAINKLVAKGLVERHRGQADRRQVFITLTCQGRKVYRAHELFHKDMIDQALVGLSLEEEEVLAAALARVKTFFEGLT
ncbi:MAG: MarR family winged helix-turn-helix transcriptional regulator [Raoultibacter sp.]